MRLWLVPLALLTGWGLARIVLRRWPIMRPNFRKEMVPVGTGVAQWLGLTLAVPCLPSFSNTPSGPWAMGLLLTLGIVGWWDDRAGDRSTGGFRGHVLSALRGKPTTGFAKMCLGGGAALLASWGLRPQWSIWTLVDALVMALAANTINLMDLRPGRARAAWCLLAALCLVFMAPWKIATMWLGTGVLGVMMDWRRDAQARAMLGDTGSNVLGGFLGLVAVGCLAEGERAALLAGLVVVNLLSERFSFSEVIERIGWLRALDRRLGERG